MPMTRQAKEQMVSELSEMMASAKGGLIANYSGLNVAAVTEIRRAFRDAGVRYKVVKNTLMKRAITGTTREGLAEVFTDTTAVALTFDEEYGRLGRVAQDLAKKFKALEVKAGFVEDDLIKEPRALDVMAALPTMDEARVQLLGVLQAPAKQILGVLNAPAKDLLGVLNAKADKDKEGETVAA